MGGGASIPIDELKDRSDYSVYPLRRNQDSITALQLLFKNTFIYLLFDCVRFQLQQVGCSFQTGHQALGPLHWEHEVLATGPPGKPLNYCFITAFPLFLHFLTSLISSCESVLWNSREAEKAEAFFLQTRNSEHRKVFVSWSLSCIEPLYPTLLSLEGYRYGTRKGSFGQTGNDKLGRRSLLYEDPVSELKYEAYTATSELPAIQ